MYRRRRILSNQHAFRRQDWRSIPLVVGSQDKHIEMSERLLAEIQPGMPPALYWSQAQEAGLVLGFSQQRTVLNMQAVSEEGIPLYHRHAGGTAVLVGPDLLDLDVVLPADHPLVLSDLVESYRWFGEAWVRTLASLGVATRVVSPTEAHAQRAWSRLEPQRAREAILRRACYASNSSYEVVVGERKLVGLDMIRRRNGSLLQAGLLLRWETDRLARLLGHTLDEQALLSAELPHRAIGLDRLTARTISPSEIISAFELTLFGHAGARSAT